MKVLREINIHSMYPGIILLVATCFLISCDIEQVNKQADEIFGTATPTVISEGNPATSSSNTNVDSAQAPQSGSFDFLTRCDYSGMNTDNEDRKIPLEDEWVKNPLTPCPVATLTSTPSPIPTATFTPTITPTITPPPTVTPLPTATPMPTIIPSPTMTPLPTVRPVKESIPIKMGVLLKDSLESFDDYDEWVFEAQAGKTLTVAMNAPSGSKVDPYLQENR